MVYVYCEIDIAMLIFCYRLHVDATYGQSMVGDNDSDIYGLATPVQAACEVSL